MSNGYGKKVLIFILCLSVCIQARAVEVQARFTPTADSVESLIELIKKESSSLRVASYRLSNLSLIKELLAARERGVSVEVIVDSASVTKRSPLFSLSDAGIPVFVRFSSEKGKARLHHAFCVFGGDLVRSGALQAFHHMSHVLLLKDEGLAREFISEFEKIKKEESISLLSYLEKKKKSTL